MRNADGFPWRNGGCCVHDDQGASPLSERGMGDKEGFDSPGAAFTETGYREPPPPTAENPHSQVGQRPDAVPMQYPNDPGREPDLDRIAHQRLRDRES